MCDHNRTKKVIKLVPEYLLKKRKTYQAIKATQAKLALLEKRKVRNENVLQYFTAVGALIFKVHAQFCNPMLHEHDNYGTHDAACL